MEKLDLTKKYKSYYSATSKPQIIDIEEVNYLSITGKGDPDGKDFSEAIQALYPVAYALKFASKALGKDFVVAKLEGLWSFDEEKYTGLGMDEAPLKIPRSEWTYRLLIRLPGFITPQDVASAIETSVAKKGNTLSKNVEFYAMREGKCIQILHTGPFSKEPETLKVVLEFSEQHGLKKNGLHHEIYLSDFRKTSPEKLKTILREPVK